MKPNPSLERVVRAVLVVDVVESVRLMQEERLARFSAGGRTRPKLPTGSRRRMAAASIKSLGDGLMVEFPAAPAAVQAALALNGSASP